MIYIQVLSGLLTALLSFSFMRCGSDYNEERHLPLIMILDQKGVEEESSALANTLMLNLAIKGEGSAILVSRAVLYNLITKNIEANRATSSSNEFFKQITLTSVGWELYMPQNMNYFKNDNQLYLLIPTARKAIFEKAFNFENLRELKLLPSFSSSGKGSYASYRELHTQLEPHFKEAKQSEAQKDQIKYFKEDLQKLFVTVPSSANVLATHREERWQAPVWDIYLLGHGSRNIPLLADLRPEEMKELLNFFNNKIRVGILFITSCFAGGTNLRTFGLSKGTFNEFNTLNFIVIINSVGDIPATAIDMPAVEFGKNQFFRRIFFLAAQLGQKSSVNLETLLAALTKDYPLKSIHREENIPQIILPGGIEIQSFTPDKTVMVLGAVKVRSAELENKSLYAYPTKKDRIFDNVLNVLIYPENINVPLVMKPSRIEVTPSWEQKMKQAWEYLPTFSELVQANSASFSEECLIKTSLAHNFTLEALKKKFYLYPNILSMRHGDVSHYFKKIIFEGDARNGEGGLIKGLRDAFGNVNRRETVKKIYIKKVEGSNDLSLLLKALRCIDKNFDQKNGLELLLPQDGELLTLENVSIETRARLIDEVVIPGTPKKDPSYALNFRLSFEIKGTAWSYDYQGIYFTLPTLKRLQKLWDFKKIDLDEYRDKFQKAIIANKAEGFQPGEQKSIVAVEKEKMSKKPLRKKLAISSLSELTTVLHSLSSQKVK